MKILKLITLARPKQWMKNLFVFAPILFAGQLLNFDMMMKNILAFIAFSFTSSVVYIINDIVDREADRAHKKKRFRPLASGEVNVKEAVVFAVVIAVVTVFILLKLNYVFAIVVSVYLVLNILYTIRLKHIVILDVFIISLGFMLRVEGGASAIEVPISSWMILTTMFLSLFLAISKRRAELSASESDNLESQRKVLGHYDITFTDQINTVAVTGTIICYALYTVSEKTVNTFHTENLIYTTPFVIYGMFRYLYLLHKKNLGESPEQIVTKDISLIINILLWFATAFGIIYKSKLSGLL
ncbi:MAG: decaprenyl-phosphate phosphoribosyltransferase [Ignavibacteriota bacterium]|nr:decaprenyl-phosphate phosphoribosyltransferase [Ignavibacteriota bacterium]